MTLTRKMACAFAVAILAGCGGTAAAPVEHINVWLCGGIDCATTRCADNPAGGSMQCNSYSHNWEALPQGQSCSPTDCTVAIDARDPCMAVVTCPVKQ